MSGCRMSSETQIVIERHEVNRWTKHSLVRTRSPKVASQIRDVVTLMPKALTHPPRGFGRQVGHVRAWMDSQSQRQGVCQHARSASCKRRHASRNREIKDHVACPGQTMHEDRRCRRDQLRQTCPDAVFYGVQPLDRGKRQRAAMANKLVGLLERARAEA